MLTASGNMLDLYMTLYADEAKCLSSSDRLNLLGHEDMHFCSRGFVRAACAVIEGVTYCMKYAALETFNQSNVILPAGEAAMLQEESYRLDDKGKLKNSMLASKPKGT